MTNQTYVCFWLNPAVRVSIAEYVQGKVTEYHDWPQPSRSDLAGFVANETELRLPYFDVTTVLKLNQKCWLGCDSFREINVQFLPWYWPSITRT